MNVASKRLLIISAMWFAIVPVGLWFVNTNFPSLVENLNIEMLAFLSLMILVAVFPIVINDTPIFMLQGVSLAVFLEYGLFVEIIFTQISIGVLLIKLRLRKDEIYRIPLNSLMFFIVSTCSGIGYYILGGEHRLYNNLDDILPIISYSLIFFLSNELCLGLIKKVIYQKKKMKIDKDLVWEFVSTIIVFPIGLALHVLFNEMQILAIFLVGVPLISLALMMKMYYSSIMVNELLQKASEINHQLAEEHRVKEVLDVFVSEVVKMFPADYTFIFNLNETSPSQLVKSRCEVNKALENKENDLFFEEIAQHIVREKKPLMFHQQDEWLHLLSKSEKSDIESILALPISRNSRKKGVFLLASNKKRAFEKCQLAILDILCSYLAIALQSAIHYEETKRKSEYCGLTGVYNYGYFESVLKREFELYKDGSLHELALIIMDIDFFKNINDTFGHESGNQILCQFVNIIEKSVNKKGVLARYGGEEFVVLLSNVNSSEVLLVAEQIRENVAIQPFKVKQLHSNQEEAIHITVSIGVASANRQDEDHLCLIRNADRVMYNGAKQNGRNKVAMYHSEG